MLTSKWGNISFIGKGEYANVFKVTNTLDADAYVAKLPRVFHNSAVRTHQNIDSLVNEMNILSKLDHPNIVKVFASGWTETPNALQFTISPTPEMNYGQPVHPVYIMEYCASKSVLLNQKIRAYPELDIRSMTFQMCLALKYLKDKSWIHRDVKLANILDCGDGTYRLADFGFAALAPCWTNTVVGTPFYMAPEIWKKDTLSFPVDMWSLGVGIYILLFGKNPFHGTSKEEIEPKIRSAQFSFPAETSVSADAQDFLSKIFVASQNNRLAVEDALEHPWLNPTVTQSITS
jgi:serine/threonine protein kinase